MRRWTAWARGSKQATSVHRGHRARAAGRWDGNLEGSSSPDCLRAAWCLCLCSCSCSCPRWPAARYRDARSLGRTAVLQRGQAGAMGVVEGTRDADRDGRGCGKSAELRSTGMRQPCAPWNLRRNKGTRHGVSRPWSASFDPQKHSLHPHLRVSRCRCRCNTSWTPAPLVLPQIQRCGCSACGRASGVGPDCQIVLGQLPSTWACRWATWKHLGKNHV